MDEQIFYMHKILSTPQQLVPTLPTTQILVSRQYMYCFFNRLRELQYFRCQITQFVTSPLLHKYQHATEQ